MSTSRLPARRSLGAALASLGTVFLLIAGLLVVFETPAALADHDPFGGTPQTSVTICHTGNGTNFTVNSPSISSEQGGNGPNGHGIQHSGDIIPPYHFTDGDGIVQSFAGRNWDADGQAFYNNDCAAPPPPTGSVTFIKTFGDNAVTAVEGDFAPTLDGSGYSWGTTNDVPTGTYAVGETSTRSDPGTWTVTLCGATLEVLEDQTTTCTINNSYSPPPTLTVTKIISGDGTGQESDFTLLIDGNSTAWGGPGTVSPGTYTVAESDGFAGPGSYTGVVSCNGSLTLADGDVRTCTITNRFVAPPTLTVNKVFVHDGGGTGQLSDFTPRIDTGDVIWAATNTVSVGAHTVDETTTFAGPGTYTPFVQCDGSLTLADGDNRICTITNTFVPPGTGSITLFKEFANNTLGPTSDQNDFTPLIGGGGVLWGTTSSLTAGPYTIGESGGPAGYTVSNDCSGSVTVIVDQDVSCTITNTFNPPLLTVTKVVIGGNAFPNDFNLQVDGAPVLSGVQNPYSLGTHTVTEGSVAGYSTTIWQGDCNVEGEGQVFMTVPGQAYTCTIINIDPNPRLTVTKTVDGVGDPDSFNLTVGAQGVLSGVQNAFPPSTYVVGETNLAGYDAGLWDGDCDPTTGQVSLEVVDAQSQPGSWIYECGITNVSTTTTTTTTTTPGTPTTTVFATTTTTDPGDTTTTTLVLGAQLPNTGPGDLLAWLIGGFGLVLLGAGLILLAPRQDPRWVV